MEMLGQNYINTRTVYTCLGVCPGVDGMGT